MRYKLTYGILSIVTLISIATLLAYLFGWMGVSITVGMFTFFVLPKIAFFGKLDLDPDEKFFLGVFISFGLFSLSVWFINRIIPSFRLSYIILVILIIIIGWYIQTRKAEQHEKEKTK